MGATLPMALVWASRGYRLEEHSSKGSYNCSGVHEKACGFSRSLTYPSHGLILQSLQTSFLEKGAAADKKERNLRPNSTTCQEPGKKLRCDGANLGPEKGKEQVWELSVYLARSFLFTKCHCLLTVQVTYFPSSPGTSNDFLECTDRPQRRESGKEPRPAGLLPSSPPPHPNISQHKHPDWAAVWERGKRLTFSSHQKLAVTSCQWEVITWKPHTDNLVLKSCFPVKFKSGQQFWTCSRCLTLLRIWAQEFLFSQGML